MISLLATWMPNTHTTLPANYSTKRWIRLYIPYFHKQFPPLNSFLPFCGNYSRKHRWYLIGLIFDFNLTSTGKICPKLQNPITTEPFCKYICSTVYWVCIRIIGLLLFYWTELHTQLNSVCHTELSLGTIHILLQQKDWVGDLENNQLC